MVALLGLAALLIGAEPATPPGAPEPPAAASEASDPAAAPLAPPAPPAPAPAAPAAVAPPAAAEPASSSGALEPIAEGQDGVVLLRSGRTITGHVIAVTGVISMRDASGKVHVLDQTAAKVSVRDRAGKVHVLKLADVRGVVREEVSPGALAGAKAPRVRVVLADGSVLEGGLVERRADAIVLETADGRRDVPTRSVAGIARLHETKRPIGHADRHLAAPTAFLLRRGEVHLASADVVDVSASVGLADFLTLSAGTALPMLHGWPYGTNARVALRSGLELAPWLHLAGGVHAAWDDGRNAVYVSAEATAGTPASHVTLYAGPTFGGANRLALLGDVGVALAGTLHLGRGFSALVEAWGSRAFERTDALLVAGGRYAYRRGALDLGLAASVRRGELLPWVGFSLDVTP